MKIVVTIAALDRKHGGPARSVPALCRALARSGAEVELITIAENMRASEAERTDGFVLTAIQADSDRYHPRSWAVPFKQALMKAVSERRDAVLYDVGLWLPSNHFAAQIARKTQVPFVVSPRGMLSPQALRIGKSKKFIAWRVYQHRDLKCASVLHATSKSEAQDVRALQISLPIAVVPNGVEFPEHFPPNATDGEKIRTLLFLSRLHPIKGLNDLVNAWARIRPIGWRVVIAGAAENGHDAEVKSRVTALHLDSEFKFAGSVDDETKWRLFRSANLFVLPSYSESFGLAIAEALAAELPVITTQATPWREIETHRCGWWIRPDVDSLVNALTDAMTKNSAELRAMGRRGRELVEHNYAWGIVAHKMVSTFDWLLGRDKRPAFVV